MIRRPLCSLSGFHLPQACPLWSQWWTRCPDAGPISISSATRRSRSQILPLLGGCLEKMDLLVWENSPDTKYNHPFYLTSQNYYFNSHLNYFHSFPSFIHSFIHSLTHSFKVHSFTHSFKVYSFIHSFIQGAFIHSFIQGSFIHSFIHFTHSIKVHSFIHSFIHLFIRVFVHSFIHSFKIHW